MLNKLLRNVLIIIINALIIVSCTVDLNVDSSDYNGDTYIRGTIIEEGTLLPIDSVRVAIYKSNFMMPEIFSGYECYTDSLGEFDCYFWAEMSKGYHVRFKKDNYAITFPGNLPPPYYDGIEINEGDGNNNSYEIRMQIVDNK